MIIIPSRGRPQKLARFSNAYRETGGTELGVVLIEERDKDAYRQVQIPKHWDLMIVPQSLSIKKYNTAFNKYPNEDCYLCLGDDNIPETPEWDVKLREEAGDYFVAYADDKLHGKPSHPCMGGEFVRSLGYVLNPILGHFFADNVIEDIARPLGLLRFRDDIIIRHLHFTITGDYDQACKERGSPDIDELIYETWAKDQKQKDIERVKKGIAEFRLAHTTADL